MNFEDYAVLKSKPEHLSIDEYITVLKNKETNGKLNKTNERSIEIDDMDVSVHSDDFVLDVNNTGNIITVDIFNDSFKNNEAGCINADVSSNNYEINKAGYNMNDACNSNNNDGQIAKNTFDDMDFTIINDETEINSSTTMLKDFDVNMASVEHQEVLNGQSDFAIDTYKILRNIEENVTAEKSKYTFESDNLTQMTCYEGSQPAYNRMSSKHNDIYPINNNKNANDNILGQNYRHENITEDEMEFSQFIDTGLAAKISKNISNHITNDSNINEIRKRTYDANTFINREDCSNNNATTTETNNIVKETSNDLNNTNPTINLEELNQSDYSNEQNKYLTRRVYNTLIKQAGIIKANDERFAVNMSIDLEELNQTEYSNKYNDQTANIVSKSVPEPVYLNDNIQKDSQETQLYSLHDLTQTYTHVSQSQIENVAINKNTILGSKGKNTNIHENGNNVEETYLPSNLNCINTSTVNVDQGNKIQTNASIENEIINNETHQGIKINPGEIRYVMDLNGKYYEILNINCLDRNTLNIDQEQNNQVHTQTAKSAKNDSNNRLFQTGVVTNTNDENAQVFPTTLSSQTSKTEEDLTVSQKETIPFKVIEELNTVKVFLGRKHSSDGSTTESGYKSDSQSRSSYRSALQLLEVGLNQSGYCLFNYLLHSPLVATVQEITREISQVLGKLIDRLHEEEKYPSFLEDLLENIEVMLQDIYRGDSICDNVMLKKDETIQRLLLLNKSMHILKFTIEKINSILEHVHSFLTDEETCEITNIDQIENICYIFHVLEALLKRYVNNKPMLTQNSTQSTQSQEALLKKSSITDIWRKKWNPNYKTKKFETHVEKRCALTKCGETLNKIIVDCIEGYSLVAFSALQCFNLLQSQ